MISARFLAKFAALLLVAVGVGGLYLTPYLPIAGLVPKTMGVNILIIVLGFLLLVATAIHRSRSMLLIVGLVFVILAVLGNIPGLVPVPLGSIYEISGMMHAGFAAFLLLAALISRSDGDIGPPPQ